MPTEKHVADADRIPRWKILREQDMQLREHWRWSLWRIVPPLAIAYLVTGAYLSIIHTPDAWMRAVGPLLTISVFLVARPFMQSWWFKRERTKIQSRDREHDNDDD